MPHIPIVTDEDATPEQATLFKHCTKLMGRVANAVRVASHAPKIAQPLIGFMIPTLREEITGALPINIKVLVILKTSMLNGCSYCIGHNSALGRSLGFTDDLIAALEDGYQDSDLFTPAEKAAIAWAECLTERTYRENCDVMPELKKHFNDVQIVEITMVSGFFNFWNRFTDGLQVDIEASEQVGLIRKSRKVDVDDYLDFMRDCWWNEDRQATDA